MVVAHYQHTDNEWHVDIGATHHLTNDVNNIHLQNEDYGNQYLIQVANSAGLKIVQSGTSTLSSPSKSFVLQSNFACPRYSEKSSLCSTFLSRQ